MCQEHTWQRHKKKAGQQRTLAMLVWGGVSWRAPPVPSPPLPAHSTGI